MVTSAEEFPDGDKSSTQFSTDVQEELGQNNSSAGGHTVLEEVQSRSSAGSQYGRAGGNIDQGVASMAAAKSKGKRKLLHPTDEQITELEACFKHNPHLTVNQREELARRSELQGSIQIRHWLRKKRHQLKVNGERDDENEILGVVINKRLENISLNEEDSKIDKALTHNNIEAIVELVRLATEELRVMAVTTEPLWRRCPANDGARVLDKVAYHRIFPNLVGPGQVDFASEASRETARIKLSPKHLVNFLMDVNKWSDMFNAIVAKARTVDVLMNPGGAMDFDGTLQVMRAEYQFPAPLVPNRESYFARYCKKYSEKDWIVVDVSLDDVHQVPGMSCKKRPSGCLIHELSNGFSKITWVEHVDVNYKGVSDMYKSLLVSGLGFGAKRWILTLDRQCQHIETNISIKVPLSAYNYQLMSSDHKAWKVILKLAERMVTSFNSGISGTTGKWEILSGQSTDNIRIMIRRIVDDPSLPRGTLVTASTTFWLPMSPNYVFDFFRDHNSRSEPLIPYTGREREVLSGGTVIEQVCHISSGQEASNYVSILKVQTGDSSRENILLLQESCSDPVASYIVYSRVKTGDMDMILSGRNSDYPRILPSGFAVLPDGSAFGTEGSSGSLLTVSFQLLVDDSPAFILPARMHSRITNLINHTSERIIVALGGCIP